MVITKEFISEEVPELVQWPSNSADPNPIGSCWNVIKQRVEKLKPENTDDLEEYMNKEMRKTKKKLPNEFDFVYER